MSPLGEDDLPLPQTGMSGGPPKPPRVTARELGDDDNEPEWKKQLSDSECKEVREWLEEYLKDSE